MRIFYQGKLMNEIISLDCVSVTRDKLEIIKNISLTIKKGENWAVIGRNGSGKSFLLRILSTEIYPSQGNCTLYGKTIGRTNLWDLRKKIGVVSDNLQSEYKKNATVEEVVISGFFSSNGVYYKPDDFQREKALELIKKSGLSYLADRKFGILSQGEKKRVLIARALVFDPDLLILDEPATGLDIASREEFLETLSQIIKYGHNIVFVTHHIEEIIPEITHVAYMKAGSLYGKGLKSDMINSRYMREVLDIDCDIIERDGRYIMS